ncbi:MAG: signal peptidase II [Chloroflexi bacterium]|nr:signal peptidase II [Chloroflexota bacterium]
MTTASQSPNPPQAPAASSAGLPLARRSREMPLLAGVAAAVWVLDQATKYLVLENLPLGASWAPFPALERFFTFTHVSNTGAAFGLLPQFGTVFQFIAILVVVGIVLFSRHLGAGQKWVTLSLGLQLGGALGNLTDRLRIGHVVDYLDFKFWPVFNVADSALFIGVGLLLWIFFRQPEQIAPRDADSDVSCAPPSPAGDQ